MVRPALAANGVPGTNLVNQGVDTDLAKNATQMQCGSHGADSFVETNNEHHQNCIKTESEPNFDPPGLDLTIRLGSGWSGS